MKKMSKRALSLLLSVLLVVTSMPMFAFASFAEGGEINEVDVTQPITDAMNAYEARMDGTVYINMANAYNAYVNAQKAKDAVKYGDKTVDIDAVAATLTSATNAMTPYTDPVANATHASRDTDGAINTDYAKNLLYAEKQAQVVAKTNTGGWNLKFQVQIVQSPNTIALYDGTNDILLPVFAFWNYDQTGTSKRGMFALYPTNNESGDPVTDNSNFNLVEAWHGSENGTGDWNAAWNDGGRIGCYHSSVNQTIQQSQTNRNKWNRAANYMKYIGGANGFSNGMKTVVPGWYGFSGKGASTDNERHYLQNAGTIYVVDYASLKTAIANKKSLLPSVATAKQGGAASLISAFDAATGAASNLKGITPATVTERAKALSDATSAINSASVAADETGYAALRTAMDSSKSTYKNADSTKYTADSWQAFARAYEAARDIFANIQTNGYNNSADAQDKADALKKAFAALKTNEVKADTSALETVIDNADDAISNSYLFTADSFTAANLEALVNAAKEGVWGGNVENYKVDAEKLNENDENIATIENYRQTLIEAINKLVINFDQTLPAASDYSINSALAYAATFKNTDYSNYDILTAAVNKANQFKNNTAVIDATSEGSVLAAVNSYVQIIRDILSAAKGLHPAFSITPNGTQISAGTEVSTKAVYEGKNNKKESVTFTRRDDQVFFRTTHDAYVFDLGSASLDFYTGSSYDAHFDSLNMSAPQTAADNTELNHSENNEPGSATDVRDYPGALSISNVGGTFRLNKIFVQSSSTDILGHDLTGANVTDPNFDFTDGLATSSGSYPAQGAVSAKNGTTKATAAYTMSVNEFRAQELSESTIPKKTVYNPSGEFGFLFWYKFSSIPTSKFTGYRHAKTPYTQKATVIDISYLFDLINVCDAIAPTGYTKQSYNDLVDALRLAKVEFEKDYSEYTVDEIVSECVTRYNRLWAAKEALAPAANNTSLKDAVAQTMATYQAGKANYSTSSWNTFAAAFEAARTAFNGKYSDDNIADYGTSEQPAIDALANALTDAYNALESFANFQPLYDAATAVANSFENEKYTFASLEAVANQLKDASVFPYLNMTEDEKKTVYADSQAAINAEAAEIAKLTAQTATVDGSALEAAIAKIKNDYKDPDAWQGVEEAIATIRAMSLYEAVEIYNGITVSGVKFADQTELDAEITKLLSSVTLKKYTVTIDGTVFGTFDYGTSIDVPSADGSIVDWYYTYSSNTSNTEGSNETYSGKYLSSTDVLTFVVKGNTTLTTKKATQETVKVTYVNALNGNIIAADYVAKGSAVTALPAAPSLVYYRFDNYTLKDGTAFTASTTVDKNTIVYANYSRTASDELYTLYIFNLDGALSFDEGYYYYNDRIEFNSADLIKSSKFDRSTATYKVNGTSVEMTASKRSQDADPIYAWALVNKNDMDAFYAMLEKGEFDQDCGYLSIIQYGLDYTFYMQDDTYLYALTEQEYKDFTHYQETDIYGQVQEKGNGMIDTSKLDENGASVSARDAIVRNSDDTKFSMIGTFTLPEGAQEVEYGMLFTTTTGSELTLENVGTNGIARMKSSQHTAGNQFVISVKSTKLAGKSVNMQYRAYLTYRAADGTLHTIYSSDVTLTEQF